MGTKQLLVGILVLCTVTTAYGFSVGTGNGALYFVGGGPSTNSNYASFGSGQAGGSVSQHATAFTPWGVGVVGQGAGAKGGQISGPGFQAQGFCAGMGQTAAKFGGSGYVNGTQTGTVGMTQGSGGSTQGAFATGMQMSGIYGGLGVGVSSQSMHVSAGQMQLH
jgi:hypothetical protein